MKELTIGPNDAGQRLDRFLAKAVPLLPASLAQKYIRLKRIKCNGKRIDRDTRLNAGDVLQLYINDEFFDKPREDNAYLTVASPKLNIVYEDENILLVDKRPGLAVHPHDGAEYGRTLIDHIQSYLYQKREWRPREENAFTPALCNRIDRNTGGIVIAAKTAEALRVMNQKIKDRELDKRYLAIVEGTPKPKDGQLKGYLFKDEKKNRVFVTDSPQPGAKTPVQSESGRILFWALLRYILRFHKQVRHLNGNGQSAHSYRFKHIFQHICAAAFLHLHHSYAGDVVVGEYLFQLGGDVKVSNRAAQKRHLAFCDFFLFCGTGKGAAIRRDQQMGTMKIGRHLRYLPELDGPLRKVTGLIVKHPLVEIIEVLPWIKIMSNHCASPQPFNLQTRPDLPDSLPAALHPALYQ